MFGFFKKQRDPEDFWAWLAANGPRIQSAGRNAAGKATNELWKAFALTYPNLVWEITPSDSGSWLFCVSADGNAERFDQVRSAVAAAPRIEGWEIKAFRQRGSLNAVINMNGRKWGYDDLWCAVKPDGSSAQVTIYVRGLTRESAESLLGASLVLLDNAVGEHDSVMKISDLNNAPLPECPVRTEFFFPLSELPAYLDRLDGPNVAARASV